MVRPAGLQKTLNAHKRGRRELVRENFRGEKRKGIAQRCISPIALLVLERFGLVHLCHNLFLLGGLFTLLLLPLGGLELFKQPQTQTWSVKVEQRQARIRQEAGASAHHVVERDVDLGGHRILRVDDGKPAPLRLPREAHHGVLHVQHFHRDPRLVESEELDVIVQGLLGLGVSRDLDPQVLAPLLPDHAALGDVEEILLTQLLPLWDGDEVNVRRLVP